MQKLVEKHRFASVDRALRFFRRRARRRPETAGLAPKVAAARKVLRDAYDAWLDAVDERVAVGAELKYLDAKLDRLVLVNLKRDLAVLTADHPQGTQLERKLFQGIAPSEGMKAIATPEQDHYVAGILERLDKDRDFETLKPHAKKLRAAQKDVDAMLSERKAAFVAERKAQGDLDVALDDARRFYNQLHPQLSLLFPNDPALVESYFLDLRTPLEGAGDGAPADAASAPAGGPA